MSLHKRVLPVVAAMLVLAAGACGDDDGSAGAVGGQRPTVVATTSILGDVVANLVGDQATVVTIMPVGADPHDFQASARQANEVREADALIVNGGGFEEGLLDVIGAAEEDGAAVLEASAQADGLEGGDPHFFSDPARMVQAAEGIVEFLGANLEGIDDGALERSSEIYLDELRRLDADVEATLEVVPDGRRVLVTDHEVFGSFAERYGFEVVGTVMPGGSTTDAASAADIARLVDVVESRDVPAIFTGMSTSGDLPRTLADEVGGVEVVELFSESLGGPGSDGETYIRMMRTNAARIAAALG